MLYDWDFAAFPGFGNLCTRLPRYCTVDSNPSWELPFCFQELRERMANSQDRHAEILRRAQDICLESEERASTFEKRAVHAEARVLVRIAWRNMLSNQALTEFMSQKICLCAAGYILARCTTGHSCRFRWSFSVGEITGLFTMKGGDSLLFES